MDTISRDPKVSAFWDYVPRLTEIQDMYVHVLPLFLQYFIRRDFAVALTVVTSLVIYYNYFVSDYHTIVTQLGIICNFFTICFFASPLSTLVRYGWF